MVEAEVEIDVEMLQLSVNAVGGDCGSGASITSGILGTGSSLPL